MEHRVGMIEVVLNAETIANIQKEKGIFSATSPFKKGSLLSESCVAEEPAMKIVSFSETFKHVLICLTLFFRLAS